MKQENVILEKSFAFSVSIVKLHKFLRAERVEREICSQLLKSGTSIGANMEEAIGGSSRKDFIHKLEIAYREARETKYWLRLIHTTEDSMRPMIQETLERCDELIKILTAILNTSKSSSVST